MNLNSPQNFKRLEEQIFQYKPNIKSTENKKYVSDRLRNQLLQSKAVVKIQRMDAEFESMWISLKRRVMLLQDAIIPKNNEVGIKESQELLNDKDKFKLNLSSESSEDETLGTLMSKQKNNRKEHLKISIKDKVETNETQQDGTSEYTESYLPLALRRNPRERKLSYKNHSSATTSRSKSNRPKLHNKQEDSVTTSVKELLVEQEELDTPTLHIKIPSLYRGNVHCIILDSLNIARKVFDYRANEAKQQQQQKTIFNTTNISKPYKKQLKCVSDPVLQQLTQQEHDLELSQLIQDVMAEACNDETLQATNALESINKNLTDNYDLVENDTFMNYSQSSQEFENAQNSNAIVDTICRSSEGIKVRKKRKYTKRSNEQNQNEPQTKRGRKQKKKNDSDIELLQPQPPTKSNLAQYVEFFSNDCDLLRPGSTTPAASSTRSQPLVSSTTHNFDVVDQLPQQEQKTLSPQPITYYIDGDWANGGPCQLVTTNGVSVDDVQLNQDDNAIQSFANYVDNNGDSISNPQSIESMGFENKNRHPASHHIHYQSTYQNSLLPIINIQIPPLPNNISSSEPPPAHAHEVVVDLSIKSKASVVNVTSTEAFNLVQKSNNLGSFRLSEDECLPLDLSAKGLYAKEKMLVTIDSQDEDFIRRLIEHSDLDYTPKEFEKRGENESLVFDHDHTKSFKAALDMPILDFDATALAQLVENTASSSRQQQNILTDKIDYNDPKNNEVTNFVSNFSDQSTSEIFNKLLDICPDNNFLNNINNQFIADDNINENVFDEYSVEKSTMSEVENPTSEKNELGENEEEVYNATSEYNQQIENTSNDESLSATPLVVHLDTSNTSKDTSLNVSIDNGSSELNKSKLTGEINLASPAILKISNEICNNTQQFSKKDEEESTTDDKSVNNDLAKVPMKKTWSEDANLYTEKSCNLCELKTKENDNNVKKKKCSGNFTTESEYIKDYSKSDKADLNLYNNEIDKSQNIGQELANNLDCTRVEIENAEKKESSNTPNEQLSLLELNSNLECPLDFDEDFDDALSLATSCFDSPTDERFEASIVDFNTTTTTNTLHDVQQDETYPNPQQMKDIKHFKIPKLGNTTASNTVPNTSEKMNSSSSSPKNSMTKMPSIEDADVMLEANFVDNEKTNLENVILKVFGVTCLSFLVDECNGTTHCELSHQLNDTEKAYRNLNTLEKIHANLAYKFMYNHSKLYKVYFNIFCTYYTNKNNRIKLLNMASDCERCPEYPEFIIATYEGLVKCGLSRVNACRLILKRIREKSIATSIVEALVAIIMKSDWTMFTDFIKRFTEEKYQFKFRICILEQMAPAVLNSKGSHLKQVFGKCFQTLHSDDTGLLLNSPILIQCVSLLTTNK